MPKIEYPSREEAEALVEWALQRNPGPWGEHVRTAARAASTIAKACGMDEDHCYTLALLHDIGRYEGRTDLRHTIAGYDLLMERGWQKAAAVCLSHSFPVKRMDLYFGKADLPPGEMARMDLILEGIPYDDEIRLIQLCDCLSLNDRVTVMEKRMIDVALRYEVGPSSPIKWQAFLNLKTYFDDKCSLNIYRLFEKEISAELFGADLKD